MFHFWFWIFSFVVWKLNLYQLLQLNPLPTFLKKHKALNIFPWCVAKNIKFITIIKRNIFQQKKGHDTCTSKPICDFILLSTSFSFLLKIFRGNGFVSGLLKLHCNKSLSYVDHFLRVTVKGFSFMVYIILKTIISLDLLCLKTGKTMQYNNLLN